MNALMVIDRPCDQSLGFFNTIDHDESLEIISCLSVCAQKSFVKHEASSLSIHTGFGSSSVGTSFLVSEECTSSSLITSLFLTHTLHHGDLPHCMVYCLWHGFRRFHNKVIEEIW